ncbi:MAG: hypothetical protein IPG33_02630 [Betaproteobacteria bacterium]|nr:hypothetical protein [Betaproteobacteria bacterium]
MMKVGVLFVDGNHRIIYINNACRDIWKPPREENLTDCARQRHDRAHGAPAQEDAAYRKHIEEMLAGEEVSGALRFPWRMAAS